MMVLAAAVAACAAVVVHAGPRDRSTAAAAESGGDVRFSRVRLDTRVELEVAESGPADGRAVLFLHGWPDSWFSFSPILGALRPEVRAIVPSLRGYGRSEKPACCYAMADFTRDAVALLDALGIARADVVGHSMGSFVAQRMAVEHPDRVGRVVLIGAGTGLDIPALTGIEPIMATLADPIDTVFVREFQVSTVHRPVPASLMNGLIAESHRAPAHVWRATYRGLLETDHEQALARIRAPLLLAWGEHDTLFPPEARAALVRALPGARVATLEGLGHSPQWEDPARVVRELNTFLGPAAGDPNASERITRR